MILRLVEIDNKERKVSYLPRHKSNDEKIGHTFRDFLMTAYNRTQILKMSVYIINPCPRNLQNIV